MAAITASNVTVVEFRPIRVMGKSYGVRRLLSIVLSSQGGTAGDIPASALGFTRITNVQPLCLTVSGPAIRLATVGLDSSSGTELVTYDVTNATDASRTTRANLTGTLLCWVEGYPA